MIMIERLKKLINYTDRESDTHRHVYEFRRDSRECEQAWI